MIVPAIVKLCKQDAHVEIVDICMHISVEDVCALIVAVLCTHVLGSGCGHQLGWRSIPTSTLKNVMPSYTNLKIGSTSLRLCCNNFQPSTAAKHITAMLITNIGRRGVRNFHSRFTVEVYASANFPVFQNVPN